MADQTRPFRNRSNSDTPRKAHPLEQKMPVKITPVPLPRIPSSQLQPSKGPSRPSPEGPASHVEGSGESKRLAQSVAATLDAGPTLKDEVPSTQQKVVIKIKRTGTAQSPSESRLATPLARVVTPQVQLSPQPTPAQLPEDPDPPLVISDIAPTLVSVPQPPISTPTTTDDVKSGLRPEDLMADTSTKKRTDEKRRKALSESLKARWSSGAMDHVPAKRRETLRKRKAEVISMESSLVGEPVATSKRTPLGSSALSPTPAPENQAQKEMDFMASFSNMEGTPDRPRRSLPRMATSYIKPVDWDGVREDIDNLDAESPETGRQLARDISAINIGDWKPLWEYIMPFLTVHRSVPPPTKGYVRELLLLPRVRDLAWNTDWVNENPYVDSRPQDISAMVMQVTGELAPEPCMRCADAKGPFKGCVMVSIRAHDNPLETIFSCANCFYHCRQTYCNHKAWGVKRNAAIRAARRTGRSRLSAKTLQGKVPLEPEDSYADDDALMGDHARDGDSPLDFGRSITMAEPGRPYNMWPEDGVMASMHGALLPRGYQLEYSLPGRNWICSVRSCRRVFQSRKDLGFHFSRVHFGCLLNDNGDGTLTITASYKSKASGLGNGGKILSQAPPLVTSTRRIDPIEPLPSPKLPKYLMASRYIDSPQSPIDVSSDNGESRYMTRKSAGAIRSAEPAASATSVGSLDSETGDPEALWSYISPFLRIPTQPSETGFVKELLRLPRRRDLIANPKRVPFHFRADSDSYIAAIIIQLTGEEARPCSRCVAGKGPFDKCYVMSAGAGSGAKKQYPGCANCLYRGKQTTCTLVSKDHQIAPGRLPAAGQITRKDVSNQNFELDGAAAGNNPAIRRQIHQQSSLITAGQSLPIHTLEMEDWEVAPGRILEEAGEDPENVAFSKAFLSANQAVPVCDDVGFRVDTIKSGTTLHIESDRNKTRICSIATGKLTIRIKGEHEQEFTIGPHGMFRVKAGVSCAVTNRLYSDGILHTTVLSGYI
ncbi:hypothetical protein GQ53DRAFT_815811 [Thozetella sp. PMI_491]|nr:hypothetical protein GQ53DRAFT_815811 [Thozetella sp. PMI_491]